MNNNRTMNMFDLPGAIILKQRKVLYKMDRKTNINSKFILTHIQTYVPAKYDSVSSETETLKIDTGEAKLDMTAKGVNKEFDDNTAYNLRQKPVKSILITKSGDGKKRKLSDEEYEQVKRQKRDVSNSPEIESGNSDSSESALSSEQKVTSSGELNNERSELKARGERRVHFEKSDGDESDKDDNLPPIIDLADPDYSDKYDYELKFTRIYQKDILETREYKHANKSGKLFLYNSIWYISIKELSNLTGFTIKQKDVCTIYPKKELISNGDLIKLAPLNSIGSGIALFNINILSKCIPYDRPFVITIINRMCEVMKQS